MSWKCYELRFKAKSGIHIGYRKLGIINQTRYFIPGKTMWGAVTAILSRRFMKNYNAKIYEKIGEFVKNHLKFSYFYLVNCGKVLYPKYDEKGLLFGDSTTKEEFENEFIYSYVSTAVDPASKTAEDGSLHEFEYIKPNVEFCGYLFANDGNGIRFGDNTFLINASNDDVKLTQDISLFNIIEKIQVGGERNYGFGWLELKYKKFCSSKEVEMYDSKIKIDLNDLTLKKFESNEIIALSHVAIDNLNFESIRGDIEPFVGREWAEEKGAGQKISDVKICLVPGTKIKLKDDVTLKIGEYGIWSKNSKI